MSNIRYEIRFPFAVQQTGENTVAIDVSTTGIRFPELFPQPNEAEAFDRAFRVNLSDHEEILMKLNELYRTKLLLATLAVHAVNPKGGM